MAVVLLFCACSTTQDKGKPIDQQHDLVRYLNNIQGVTLTGSKPSYCILYFSSNCSICNSTSDSIISSICNFSTSDSLIFIAVGSKWVKPDGYCSKFKFAIDKEDAILRYGLNNERHMFYKFCGNKVLDELQIVEQNRERIFKSLQSECE